MDTAAAARLVCLAVIMREASRGAIVSEPVDLRHVLRRDYTGELGALAGCSASQRHREVHDEALDARPFDCTHGSAFGAREEAGGLKASRDGSSGVERVESTTSARGRKW